MLLQIEIILALARFDGFRKLVVDESPVGLVTYHMTKKFKDQTITPLELEIVEGKEHYVRVEGPDYLNDLNEIFRLQTRFINNAWELYIEHLNSVLYVDSLVSTKNPTIKHTAAIADATAYHRAKAIFSTLKDIEEQEKQEENNGQPT